MVDYNITVPQPYDSSSDIANALRFRAARQAEVENQLKLQAWQEDRAYQLQQRQAAAANAAAKRAREQELLGIYGNFGVTPAVTGARGVSYSDTGVSNDPYAAIQNELVRKGFLPQAENVVEYQNKMLTGKKTEAETAKEAALTSKAAAETTGINFENVGKRLEMWKQRAQMIRTPEEAAQFSLAMQSDPALKDFTHLVGDPQAAAAKNAAAFASDPQGWLTSMIALKPEDFQKAISPKTEKLGTNERLVTVSPSGQAKVAIEGMAPEDPTKVVTHQQTDSEGNVTNFNKFGQVINVIPKAGKGSEAAAKAEQDAKKQTAQIDDTIGVLQDISKPGGLLDKSTGSPTGAAVDYVAGSVGYATEGAKAIAELKVRTDPVLKLIPRFEGPQSDKDTATYKEAAGQLSDPSVPVEVRKAAAKALIDVFTRRKGQFAAPVESGTAKSGTTSGGVSYRIE